MKPDFLAMTKTQLRAYLVAHPDDQDAFYAFVDRFTAQASETFSMAKSPSDVEAVTTLIQQKVEQAKTSQ
jgi:uncharacterized protein with von Willebrand factor type A (vWA) domain